MEVMVERQEEERKVHISMRGLSTDDPDEYMSENAPYIADERLEAVRDIGFHISRVNVENPEPSGILERIGIKKPSAKSLSSQLRDGIEEMKQRIDKYHERRQCSLDKSEFQHGIERAGVPSTNLQIDDGYPEEFKKDCSTSSPVESVLSTVEMESEEMSGQT